MADIVKGPFDVTWGANTLADVEEVEIDYEQESEDYTTLAHRTYEVDGPIKVSASIVLLSSDIPSLGAVLPQMFVAQGGTMSTGEEVDSSVGAIDVVANCESNTYNDLEIESCGNPGQVLRLVNTRTKIDSIEQDAMVRKYTIKFVGESPQGQAPVQEFLRGGIS